MKAYRVRYTAWNDQLANIESVDQMTDNELAATHAAYEAAYTHGVLVRLQKLQDKSYYTFKIIDGRFNREGRS